MKTRSIGWASRNVQPQSASWVSQIAVPGSGDLVGACVGRAVATKGDFVGDKVVGDLVGFWVPNEKVVSLVGIGASVMYPSEPSSVSSVPASPAYHIDRTTAIISTPSTTNENSKVENFEVGSNVTGFLVSSSTGTIRSGTDLCR